MSDIERLLCCALIRDGQTHKGFRAHRELRASLGDEDPTKELRGDRYGFWTSNERFVDRVEGSAVGYAAGQVRYPRMQLLSSDIDWDAKPKTEPKRKLYGKRPKPLFRV